MKKLLIVLMLPLLFMQAGAQETESTPKAAEEPCPCCGEKYRQFDFWVGDWNTYGPKGNLVGTNNILLLQDQCVIQENWQSEGFPYSGTSYNYYDKEEDEWVQTWVDNKGGSLQLRGGIEDGSMVLKSEAKPVKTGGSDFNKITWTPNDDGSVRQHWEVSKDYGATWSTVFDGIYKKRDSVK